MTESQCSHGLISSTKLALPSLTGLLWCLRYFEYKRIMSESKGPSEESEGPPEASERPPEALKRPLEASKGPPEVSEGPSYNIRDLQTTQSF